MLMVYNLTKTGLNVKKGMNFIITKVMKNNRKLEQENIEPEDTSQNIDQLYS